MLYPSQVAGNLRRHAQKVKHMRGVTPLFGGFGHRRPARSRRLRLAARAPFWQDQGTDQPGRTKNEHSHRL